MMIKRQPPTRKFAIEFRDDKIRRCYFHVVLLERHGNGPWKEVLRGAKEKFYKYVGLEEYYLQFYGNLDWQCRNIVDGAEYEYYSEQVQHNTYQSWDDLPNFQFKHEKDSPIEWQRVGAYSYDSWDRLRDQAKVYWYNRCLLNKR